MRSFTFTDPSTGFVATMTVTENTDGSLSFVIAVDESTGTTGDLRAIYFNNADNTNWDGLGVFADGGDIDDLTLRQDIDAVKWVGSKSTNINGDVLKENDGAFDTGIELGSQGISTDDVQLVEFTLSGDGLSLESFDFGTIGLRVMSVGDVDGDRNGSLKLSGEEDTPPPEPEPSDLVAQDDFAFVTLLDLEEPAGQSDGISLGDALANDYDPDPGDTFEIISVSGANGTDNTADENGWFGWVEGSNGGELRLNLDGTYQIRDPGGEDFVNPGLFDPLTTTIDYEIMDNHGVIASATIHVDIEPSDFD